MKFRTLLLLPILTLSTLSAQNTTQEQEVRVFKGTNGKEIKAALIDKNDTSATLLLENKRRAVVPLTSLSAKDQDYIKSWSKEKALFLQKCLGLSVRQLLELQLFSWTRLPLRRHPQRPLR